MLFLGPVVGQYMTRCPMPKVVGFSNGYLIPALSRMHSSRCGSWWARSVSWESNYSKPKQTLYVPIAQEDA